jgi:hypothetical protein
VSSINALKLEQGIGAEVIEVARAIEKRINAGDAVARRQQMLAEDGAEVARAASK